MHLMNFLISPSKAIHEPAQRRQAQFLSITLLVLLAIAWLIEVFSYFAYNTPEDPYTDYQFTLISSAVLVVAYGLSRTRYYSMAGDLTIFVTLISVLDISYFSDPETNYGFIYYAVLPIFLSSIFFSIRKSVVWIGITLASVLFVPAIWRPESYQVVFEMPFILLVTFSIIALLLAVHRESLEKDREKVLADQIVLRTQEQEKTNVLLSQSVAELEMTGDRLRSHLELEKIVADLSAGFVNMQLNEIDAEIERCLKIVGEFIGAERCFVYMNSPDKKSMLNTHKWLARNDSTSDLILPVIQLNKFPTLAEKLSYLSYIFIPNVNEIQPAALSEKEELLRQDFKSVLVLALAHEKTVFGCMGFASESLNRVLQEYEILQIKTVAEIVSNALVHKKAEQDIQRKNTQQIQLITFARQLSSTLLVDVVLDLICKTALDLFSVAHFAFFPDELIEPGNRIIVSEKTLDQGQRIFANSLHRKMVIRSVEQKRCLVCSHEVQTFPQGELQEQPFEQDYLILPFLSGDVLLGGLCLERDLGSFSLEEVQLAETFSALSSAALKNAWTYASLQHEMDERTQAEKLESALYHISEASHNPTSLNDLFVTIHQIVAGLIPAQNLYIALYDEQTDLVSFPYFVDENDASPEPHRLENSLTDYVIRSGQPLLLNREKRHQLNSENKITVSGALSYNWLGVPLKIASGKTLGMMAIQYYDQSLLTQYTEKEQDILNFVSNQVAVAIDRHNVQSALFESEARFRVVSDMTSDFAYAMKIEQDNSSAIIWVTDAVFRITGFSREEMLAWPSSSIPDLVHPEDRYEFDRIERAWRANQSYTNTFRIVTKNLEIRHIRHIARPLWSESEQRVVTGIGAVQDITEQVNAAEQLELAHTELELRVQERTAQLAEANETLLAEIAERRLIQQFLQESEERYRSVSETAKDGIVTINQKMEIVAWNKGAENIFGFKLDEIIGQQLTMIIPSGFVDLHKQAMREEAGPKIGPDASLVIEAMGERKNGEQFPAELNFSSWSTRDGFFMTSFVRDITSRKAAEAALRRMYNENRQLLLAIKSILIVVNASGVVTFWNDTAAGIFELESEQTLGKRLDELSIHWDCAILLEKIGECKISQQNIRLDDIVVQYPEHDERIIGFTVTPLTDINSGDSGALLLGSDITKRRIMEQQLVQAQKLEAIGQLAAGIAHEINTPTQFVNSNLVFLNSRFVVLKKLINLYGELRQALQNGSARLAPDLALRIRTQIPQNELDYVLREYPKAMEQSLEGTQRISHIVQAMREFSHPGGQIKTPTDINHALQSTIEVTRNAWKHVAELEMSLSPDLPLVECLPAELNQCFLNILVNAVDAIRDVVGEDPLEKGIIRIETSLNEPWVDIRISDTGCGIPESVLNRIYDPFFTTKDIGKGTGQGLSISHNIIVNKHQGEISCQSKPGAGTTFLIRLPVRQKVSAISE